MMKIEGRYTFHLPITEVYEALRDEALIRQALPGSVYFRMTSPTHYEAAMELDVPRFGGRYAGELDVIETEAPHFYRLKAGGQSPDRPILAEGLVSLSALAPQQTEVHYLGHTDAFDSFNRLIQLAAPPIAAQFANRGLAHLERVIQARRSAAPNGQG